MEVTAAHGSREAAPFVSEWVKERLVRQLRSCRPAETSGGLRSTTPYGSGGSATTSCPLGGSLSSSTAEVKPNLLAMTLR